MAELLLNMQHLFLVLGKKMRKYVVSFRKASTYA
jgi:hypothetical protein